MATPEPNPLAIKSGDGFVNDTVRMYAHCRWHQRDEWRCQHCNGLLLKVGSSWYCTSCLRTRDVARCPVCESEG